MDNQSSGVSSHQIEVERTRTPSTHSKDLSDTLSTVYDDDETVPIWFRQLSSETVNTVVSLAI